MSRITDTKQSARRLSKKRGERGGAPELGSLEHILAVLDVLDDAYGGESLPRDEYATGEPLDGLMLTLLSQNTNDRNRDIAYGRLREACASWDDVAALSADEIEELIRPAGLGETKALRMKGALAKIMADTGAYSLKTLKDWAPSDVRSYLCSIEGIGPKTAACVMVFDLGMTAFPVDTHVARLSRRFGFAAEKDSPEKIQAFLESIVPPERCMGGHLNMISHGRAICGARAPKCGECGAASLCRYLSLRDA